MIAGQWQPRHDGLRRPGRVDPARRELVADDAIVRLGMEVAVVDGEAGSSRVALRLGWTEPDDVVGPAVPLGVLQGNQKRAGWGRVVVVIAPAPGVDVDDPV